jgi:hypothetical protein
LSSKASIRPVLLTEMSHARLQAIADHLAHVAPDDAAWLRAVLEDIETGVPANEALGFSPANQRARRDAAIRRAAELINGSDWQRAQKLELWIRWLEHDVTPPRDCDESTMERALDAAQATGLALPKSARQIYRILTDI